MTIKEKKPLNIQIGDRIRQARESAGYTQEKFAELIDVSVQYISDLERGVVGTSIPTLIKICDKLYVSSDFLLFGYLPDGNKAELYVEKLNRLTPDQSAVMEKAINIIIEAFNTAEKK